MSKSKLEEEMEFQIKGAKLPEPEREFVFIPGRRFRLDFAWVDVRIGLELDGGIFLPKSGHNTGVGISRDIEKGNLSLENGWKVYRATSKTVKDGSALKMIEGAIKREKYKGQAERVNIALGEYSSQITEAVGKHKTGVKK